MLAARYNLRITDRSVLTPTANEEYVPADLGDIESLRRVAQGVDAIIHLGGFAVENDFETILAANIVGAHNLYEAARLEGVKRVVLASTNHVMGFYPRSETVGVERRVRPDSRYGLSKAFGEGLGSLYADKYGVSGMAIRIGHFTDRPKNPRDLAIWMSPRDFVQLCAIGIEHPDIHFEIVYGMSDNKRAWWDPEPARSLGYKPEDHSEDYAAEVFAAGDGIVGDPRVDLHQGAEYTISERLTV
jgi:uronate dehydrogenase